MIIQWYPGHMAKAKKMLAENLKMVDVVAEIIDARAPAATRNPDFDNLFKEKSRIILLNKADLAAPDITQKWVHYYSDIGISASGIASIGNTGRRAAIDLMNAAVKEKAEKWKAKGVNKTLRIMVVGIPNVGKSTFINRITGETRAKTGDKPGVTKAKQWIKAGDYLELMDSPGLLWPRLEDNHKAMHLAYIGSINDEIIDIETLSESLLNELMISNPEKLIARYSKINDGGSLLEGIAKSRGFLLSGGIWDTERAAIIAIDEFRAGKIGRISLETPSEFA